MDKRPFIANWQHAHVASQSECFYWFGGPERNLSIMLNLGIVLGIRSKNLIVIDFDNLEAYHAWAATHPHLITFTVKTARGVHLYYHAEQLPPHKLKMWVDGGEVGDVLTTGCYVVGPTSIHPSGIEYTVLFNEPIRIIESIDELELSLKPTPARAAVVDAPRGAQGRGSALPHGSNGLQHLADRLLSANEGNRNNLLLWCACRALDSGMSMAGVEQLLTPAALRVGLSEREVAATLRSAGKQERQAPERRPAPPERRHERRPSTIADRARARARRMSR